MRDDKQAQIGRRGFIKRVAAGTAAAVGSQVAATAATDTTRTRSYNPAMKYRPLGQTGLMVSAVCLGGHWKRVNRIAPGCFEGGNWLGVDLSHEGFRKNRYDVVSRCSEHGINYIDACTRQEVMAYGEALKGRRDLMYLGFSWYQEELRNAKCRTAEALIGTLEKGMKAAGLEYVDLWRITMHEQSSRHTEGEVDEMMKALKLAREQGKARFTGFSSHDRPHIKWMIETYPDVVQAACTPFTAKTKERPTDSLFEATRKHDVGLFGIKPFASNSMFKGDGTLEGPEAVADDEIARLAIRHILSMDCITAPIPGLINTHQVDNVARAVGEPWELSDEERAKLAQATDEMYAKLPPDYQWLRDWEWV